MRSEEGAFLTHANYLRALAAEGGRSVPISESKALAKLAARVHSSPSMAGARPISVDYEQVRRSLAHAWGTELLLALSGRFASDDEFVRLSNNWAVVQVYYVLYHVTQALAVAKGFLRPDSHAKTQNQYVSFWLKRPLNLAPWTLGAKASGWCNCPAGQTIDSAIHAWSACGEATQLSIAAKALRTTRDDAVAEAASRLRDKKKADRRRAWLADEAAHVAAGRRPRQEPTWAKPQLTALERQDVDSKVSPHGLIHYLYRLRIKTNYVDSAMFTDGPPDETSSGIVQCDLRYLASSTMLVHELHIGSLVGPARVASWADNWLAANTPAGGLPLGLRRRRHLL